MGWRSSAHRSLTTNRAHNGRESDSMACRPLYRIAVVISSVTNNFDINLIHPILAPALN